MLANIKNSAGKKILELGCGTGYLAYLLAKNLHCKVVGADLCGDFIDEAKKNYILPNLTFIQADFTNKGVIKEKFDYIIGNGFLHHLFYSLDDALRDISQLLKPDGKILFCEPNSSNPICHVLFKTRLGRKIGNLEPGEMAFNSRFIKKKLMNAGFRMINIENRDFLLPNTPDFFVTPCKKISKNMEKTFLKDFSQSIYISALK